MNNDRRPPMVAWWHESIHGGIDFVFARSEPGAKVRAATKPA